MTCRRTGAWAAFSEQVDAEQSLQRDALGLNDFEVHATRVELRRGVTVIQPGAGRRASPRARRIGRRARDARRSSSLVRRRRLRLARHVRAAERLRRWAVPAAVSCQLELAPRRPAPPLRQLVGAGRRVRDAAVHPRAGGCEISPVPLRRRSSAAPTSRSASSSSRSASSRSFIRRRRPERGKEDNEWEASTRW